MNRTQLVSAVAEKTGLKKKDAETAVAAVFASIEESLVKEEKVQLFGFGTFNVERREARQGRNPATGESITIPASKQVKFAPASTLKEKVNG
jgi:DNA-binding protein HU-beta